MSKADIEAVVVQVVVEVGVIELVVVAMIVLMMAKDGCAMCKQDRGSNKFGPNVPNHGGGNSDKNKKKVYHAI